MGTCSAGYAYAAKIAMEYAYYYKYQTRTYINALEFLQCDYDNNGCLGGYPERSLDYAFINGMALSYNTASNNCQRS